MQFGLKWCIGIQFIFSIYFESSEYFVAGEQMRREMEKSDTTKVDQRLPTDKNSNILILKLIFFMPASRNLIKQALDLLINASPMDKNLKIILSMNVIAMLIKLRRR